MADWTITSQDIDDGEWHLWDTITRQDHPEIAAAVGEFEAHDRNPVAAKGATDWLRQHAVIEQSGITRIFIAGGHVAAYYTLSSAEALLKQKQSDRVGVTVGRRVGSSHIEWLARDRRAPSGTGRLAVLHAIDVAEEVAELQATRILTGDPADQETHDLWIKMGFYDTETVSDDGIPRIFLPLFGPYYGAFSRSTT